MALETDQRDVETTWHQGLMATKVPVIACKGEDGQKRPCNSQKMFNNMGVANDSAVCYFFLQKDMLQIAILINVWLIAQRAGSISVLMALPFPDLSINLTIQEGCALINGSQVSITKDQPDGKSKVVQAG